MRIKGKKRKAVLVCKECSYLEDAIFEYPISQFRSTHTCRECGSKDIYVCSTSKDKGFMSKCEKCNHKFKCATFGKVHDKNSITFTSFTVVIEDIKNG